MTYGWLLHTLGFRFRVLADHFLVHYPHSRDTGWQKTEDGSPAWQEKVPLPQSAGRGRIPPWLGLTAQE